MSRIAKCSCMKVALSLFFFMVSFLACGSGGSTPSGDINLTGDVNLDGIWRGTYGKTAENKRFASLMYDGEIKIVTEDNIFYAGTYSTTNGNFSATIYNANAEIEITGTATAQYQIDATYKSTASDTGNLTMQFNNDLYQRESSFELLSGDWSGTTSNFSIDETGYLTGNIGSCQISGTFSIIDQECNLYILDTDLSHCQQEGQYHGLAALRDADGVRNNNGLIGITFNDQLRLFTAINAKRQ